METEIGFFLSCNCTVRGNNNICPAVVNCYDYYWLSVLVMFAYHRNKEKYNRTILGDKGSFIQELGRNKNVIFQCEMFPGCL